LAEPNDRYRIVKLANGTHSVHSLAYAETFHPVIGPIAEAEALYVRQLRLVERLQKHEGTVVIWDVGLGAAANVIAVLEATRQLQCALQFVSFDNTLRPLQFALQNVPYLDYLAGYEQHLSALLVNNRVEFEREAQAVRWEVHLADFPSLLQQPLARELPKPHVIMFDAFSPAKNPAMWTQPGCSSCWIRSAPGRCRLIPEAQCYGSLFCWRGFSSASAMPVARKKKPRLQPMPWK